MRPTTPSASASTPSAAAPSAALSPISALSPLDGRYAGRLGQLRPFMSELGYMHRRVQVEIAWFIALSDAGSCRVQAAVARRTHLPPGPGEKLQRGRWPGHQGHREDHQPRRESRGVLDQVANSKPGPSWRKPPSSCTSPAPAKTSTTPATRCSSRAGATRCCCPRWTRVIAKLREMAHAFAAVPMLSRTHGQTASPTTVGKEIANVVVRLAAAREKIAGVKLLGKMNGAVGNYNAHLSAWPDFDWEAFSRNVIETARAARPGPDLPALQHPDRAARLHGRAVRRDRAHQHHPDRPLARHLGLCEPGLFQAAPEGRRDRLVDHAAQGQPDRLRERRRQPGPVQRAAAPPAARSCPSAAGSAT